MAVTATNVESPVRATSNCVDELSTSAAPPTDPSGDDASTGTMTPLAVRVAVMTGNWLAAVGDVGHLLHPSSSRARVPPSDALARREQNARPE
jgi:hypothetical protein